MHRHHLPRYYITHIVAAHILQFYILVSKFLPRINFYCHSLELLTYYD